MVSAGDVILVVGLGLAVFFGKDILAFLDSLRSFRATDLVPDITIFDIPEFPKFPEFEFPTFELPTFEFPEIIINRAPEITSKQTLVESKQVKPIEETFGTTVRDEPIIEGKVIPDVTGGRADRLRGVIEPREQEPTTEIVTTQTVFGGQTQPKIILSAEEATGSEINVAQQPDLALVSPFLKAFQDTSKLFISPDTTSIFTTETRRIR